MAANEIKINDEKGQAVFEMIIFVPLFIFLFTIIYNVGSSINISINQQKAARRYFYYLSKGSSFLPLDFNLSRYRQDGDFSVIGMSFIGYRQRDGGSGGATPIATCMKFSSFLTGDESEECEDPVDVTEEPAATSFVRIYTGYGVCGDTYRIEQAPHRHWVSTFSGSGVEPDPRSRASSCTMVE